jgi:hypothetical protein
MNADGSDQRQLTRDFATEPSYSAAAGQIFYSKPQLRGIVSLFSIRPDGSAEQGIDRQFWDNWEPAVPAGDAQRIAFDSSRENLNWEIWLSRFPGVDEAPRLVTCEPTAPAEFPELLKWAPAWSRDGTKIAFVVSTGKDEFTGEANIWVMEADGTNCRALTDTPNVVNNFPDWSPDVSQIVIVSNRNGPFELFVMGSDGSRLRKVPGGYPLDIDYPAWSSDENWLTFSASTTPGDHTPDDIFIMTINGTGLTNLTEGNGDNWYSDWID